MVLTRGSFYETFLLLPHICCHQQVIVTSHHKCPTKLHSNYKGLYLTGNGSYFLFSFYLPYRYQEELRKIRSKLNRKRSLASITGLYPSPKVSELKTLFDEMKLFLHSLFNGNLLKTHSLIQ